MTDLVDNLKKFIRDSGPHIIQKWKKMVGNHELNIGHAQKMIDDQYDINPNAGSVLEYLIHNIQHISFNDLLNDLKEKGSKFKSEIQQEKFLIVLSGVYPSYGNGGSCLDKSNFFLSMLFLIQNPELIDSFDGYICEAKLLNGSDFTTFDILYIDDASLSGNQATSAFSDLYGYDYNDRYHLHIMILYVTDTARTRVFQKMVFDNVQYTTYYTEIKPNHVGALLRKFKGTSNMKIDDIYGYASKFLFGESGHKDFRNSLFYTDLKVPDDVSVYPRFLLNPGVIQTDGTLVKYNPLVSNCEMADISEMGNIDSGVYCPYPVYKRNYFKDIVSGLEGDIKETVDKRHRKNH